MLTILNADDSIAAIVRIASGPCSSLRASDGGASLFRALKNVPLSCALVTAHYPGLNRTFVINNGETMNFDLFDGDSVVQQRSDLPFMFVCPYAGAEPDDGVLTYRVVSEVRDLLDIAEGSVLLFDEKASELLSLLCDRGAVFGVAPQVLGGAPATVYPAWFEEATHALERVSYDVLVADLRAAATANAALAAENQTSEQRERAVYTRANGNVRTHRTMETELENGGEDDDVDEFRL